MASIKEIPKKDGSISYKITVSLGRDSQNKQIIKTATFTPTSKAPTKARKEIEAFAADFEKQVKSGDIVTDEKITFEKFAAVWGENWLPQKTLGVQERYQDILRIRVFPYIGQMKINAIRATHIDKIIKDELKPKEEGGKGLSPKSVRDTFTVINSVMKYALKKQYISSNPCLRCDDLPTIEMRKGEDLCFFNEDQAKRFINDALTMEYIFGFPERKRINKKTGEKYSVAAYQEKHAIPLMWRVYFTMAIYSQLRRGEMCALTWRDIDFDGKMVDISKSLAKTKKDGQYIKDPKTKSGIRTISLPSAVIDLLKEWKKEQAALCFKLGTAWEGHRNSKDDSFEDNNIFIQLDNGKAVNLSTPGHKFHEIIDLYNDTRKKSSEKLPKIRLHDLRHTGATLLIGKNVDIEVISKRLGHSKPSVTLDIYGHALPENDRKASDILETALGS